MPDMLVRLYDLPEAGAGPAAWKEAGIVVKRAMTPDRFPVIDFVNKTFGEAWAGECETAFANKPVSCFVAVKDAAEVVGFACYEATWKDYFGPTGIREAYRGMGLGTELLLRALGGLRDMGYAYGIIGGAVEAVGFYRKTVHAVVIPDSVPSIYRDRIRWKG